MKSSHTLASKTCAEDFGRITINLLLNLQLITQSHASQTRWQMWSTFGLLEETVGREFFRFAQHPPHTRFDTMGGFFDQ